MTVVAISGGSPMGLKVGLQASAGRGFNPQLVLYCDLLSLGLIVHTLRDGMDELICL